MGRPPRSDVAGKLRKFLATDAEWSLWQRAAKSAGTTVSDAIRTNMNRWAARQLKKRGR